MTILLCVTVALLLVDTVCAGDVMDSLGLNVTMSITNIGTQGYPGVGKTSILDLAVGKKPALERHSTGCVDPPVRYMLIESKEFAGIKWEDVPTAKLFEMLCGAVKKCIDENVHTETDLLIDSSLLVQMQIVKKFTLLKV